MTMSPMSKQERADNEKACRELERKTDRRSEMITHFILGYPPIRLACKKYDYLPPPGDFTTYHPDKVTCVKCLKEVKK